MSTNLVIFAENIDENSRKKVIEITEVNVEKLLIVPENKIEEIKENKEPEEIKESEKEQWEPREDVPLPAKWQKITEDIADEENIDVNLIYTIMFHESRFNQNAINYNKNGSIDKGICQINSSNWRWLEKEGINVHTLEGNIRACARMLRIYFEKGYSVEDVFAAYAGGEGGMKSKWAKRASYEFVLILNNQEVFKNEEHWVQLKAQHNL